MHTDEEEQKKFAEYVKEKIAGNPYIFAYSLVDQISDFIQKQMGVSEASADEAIREAVCRKMEIRQNVKNFLERSRKPGSS